MIVIRQIAALLSVTMANWRGVLKQPRMADWFERGHNTEAKLQFFIGAADAKLPLWNPNANPIESWHNQLQHLPGVVARAAFTTALEVTIPAICKDASLSLAAKGWLFQPGCIPHEMAKVAIHRLLKGPGMAFTEDRSVFHVISRKFAAKFPGHPEPTPRLLKAYQKSLNGVFKDGVVKEEAQDVATSMHTVRRDPRFKGASNLGYRCDCKRFVHIGLCSCVLMVAHFGRLVDLHALVKR